MKNSLAEQIAATFQPNATRSLLDIIHQKVPGARNAMDAVSQFMASGAATGDYGATLAEALNKTAVATWSQFRPRWERFGVQLVSKNLKEQMIAHLLPRALNTVAEGRQYDLQPPPEASATATATKRGAGVRLNWEAIINDDLFVFSEALRLLYIAGLMAEDTAVADAIAAASVSTGSAGVPTSPRIDELAALLAAKTNASGDKLSLRAKTLLCPPDIAMRASESLSVYNFNVRDEDRIDLVVMPELAVTRWYLIADWQQVPAVGVSFLGGLREPQVFQIKPPLVDALDFYVRHSFAAVVLNTDAIVANAGA